MHLLHPTDLAKLSFGLNWVQKAKISISDISRMLYLKMDFNFAYFTNFNFAHLEIEKKLSKIAKWLISLAIFIPGI